MTGRIRSRQKLFVTFDVRTAFEVCKRELSSMLVSDREYYPNSESSERETQIGIFEELDKEFQFTLDVCVTKEKAKAIIRKLTRKLGGDWGG